MDTLLDLLPTPINSFSWTVGGIVVFLYGLRGLKAWKKTHNRLSKYFALLGIFAGVGLFFYGGAALIGLPHNITLVSMVLGIALADAGLYIHSLFTIAYIKSKALRRAFQIGLAALGVVAITFWAMDSFIEQTETLTLLVISMRTAYIQGAFLILTLLPASIIFLNKSSQYDDWKLKLRAIIFSFSHITLGGIVTAGYILNQNRDTEISALVSLLLFIVFGLCILILTNTKRDDQSNSK